MSAPGPVGRDDGLVRRGAYAILVLAVRGRREQGGTWGEAVLAEYHETKGARESMRWMIGGLRVAWQERRARVRQLPRWNRVGRQFVTAAVAGCLVTVVAHQFVATSVYIPSGSMEPTMLIGDRYLIDKVGFQLDGLHRDDIVTFVMSRPADASFAGRTFIKRVVGLPGDVMACRDGAVLRNGTVIAHQAYPDDHKDLGNCPETTVPDGHAYVLGDHLAVSIDSRRYGPIAQKDITGRVAMRIWPLVPSGKR